MLHGRRSRGRPVPGVVTDQLLWSRAPGVDDTDDGGATRLPSVRRWSVRRWSRPNLSVVAPFVLAVVGSLWFFRATFLHGTLPGDVIDARWSLTVLEHWFKVWSGDAAIRDLGVFHPVDTT